MAGLFAGAGLGATESAAERAPEFFGDPDADAACDPNYAIACVPRASDVDCAGGEGNGPAYVEGPVRVIGVDIYRLDRDGDGLACEPNRN